MVEGKEVGYVEKVVVSTEAVNDEPFRDYKGRCEGVRFRKVLVGVFGDGDGVRFNEANFSEVVRVHGNGGVPGDMAEGVREGVDRANPNLKHIRHR